jgi:cysteinyl-tRNA synthetase
LDVNELVESFYKSMNDDFNAPILLSKIFDAVKYINNINDGNATISKSDLALLTLEINSFVSDVLGLTLEKQNSDSKLAPVMDLVLDMRKSARENISHRVSRHFSR